MELTAHQKILIMLFRAIEMEHEEQAILLTLLDEKEQIMLIEWAIDFNYEAKKLPTEQEIMFKVSDILKETRH